MSTLNGKTKPSTHGERRISPAGTAAAALLDQLDRLCEKRDLSEGKVGNLVGKLHAAEAALAAEQKLLASLEVKANHTRAAFTVLSSNDATIFEPLDDDPDPAVPSTNALDALGAALLGMPDRDNGIDPVQLDRALADA